MDRRRFLSLTTSAAAATLLLPKAFAATGAGRRTGLLYDKRFLNHWLQPGHPESPQRLQAVVAALSQAGLFDSTTAVKPQIDADRWIHTIHTAEHIASLKQRHSQGQKITQLVVSGVLEAVDQVCRGELANAFCATRPPGHHAENTGRVEGFCFYNHVAIAARYAQEVFGYERVLIVDWDYHHGNGTESAFYSDPSVLFFSTHDVNAYPGTGHPARQGTGAGKGYNINIHLPCGTTDKMIVDTYQQRLVPVVQAYKPDLILLSCGFDSRQDDLLGCYDVTDAGFVTLTRMMLELADIYCQGRLVSILEGGYTPDGLASACVAHVQSLLAGNPV